MRKEPIPNPGNHNRGPGEYSFNNPRVPMTEKDEKDVFRARYPQRLRDYKPEIVLD